MKLPHWLPRIGVQDEKKRAAAGLTPKKDGWYKSIGGRTRYIARPMPVADAIEVLKARFPTAAPSDPNAPRIAPSALTLEALVELFLRSMLLRVQTSTPKKMARRTYDDYAQTLAEFAEVVGADRLASSIGPVDFSKYVQHLAGKSKTTLRRNIIYVDRLFNWSGPGKKSMNLIPFAIRGPDWQKPSDEEIFQAAADKAYSPAQIKAAFDKAKPDPFLHAAAHLGLNGAFGPKDIGTLPESLVNLDAAEIRFPRGKTGVARLCPLLPQTVEALRAYLVHRAKFKSVRPAAAHLFFRSREGYGYDTEWIDPEAPDERAYRSNRVTRLWSAAVGLPFSGLRSTVATWADDWPDQRAVDLLLGHKVGQVGRHIRRHYAKQFDPGRARKLVEHVWAKAWGKM